MRKTGHPVEPEELMAYLDGELAPVRAAEMVTHLERCEECKKMAADLRTVSREMAAWEVEGAKFGLREVRAPSVLAKPQRVWWRRPLLLWTAAAAALFGSVGLLMLPSLRVAKLEMPEHEQHMSAMPARPNTLQPGMVLIPDRPIHPTLRAEGYNEVQEDIHLTAVFIARTAEISLVTSDFARACAQLDAILAARGGFASQLTVSTANEHPRSIEGTLSVPATQLDSTLADLRTLGRVESESQNGTDVTAQSVDLDARLSNARTTERSLLQLIANRGGALKDVLAVEIEVGRVRGEIESMEAQKKSLATQVARSTITVHIQEEQRSQLASNGIGLRLRNAVVEGFRAMEDSLIDAGVLIVSRGPVILLWLAILFFPGRFAWRRWRQRR
jgi:hypothetical protein